VKGALAHLRGERNRRRREEESAMRRPEPIADPLPEQRELALAARRAVAELPEELRLATTLRFGEGLTFAQIGDCLGIAEPTAFERVQKALAKLRERLGRLGFAAPAGVAGELERWLAADAAGEAIAIPATLAPKLVALASAGAGSLLAGKLVVPIAAGLLLAIGAGALALRPARRAPPRDDAGAASAATVPGARAPVAGGGSVEPATASRSEVAADATPDDTSATATPTDERAAPLGTLVGVVVDDEGRGVAGAQLAAVSTEGASKAMEWRREAVSDADGAFALALPIVVPATLAAGQHYTLALHHDDFVDHRSEPFAVKAGATCDLGRVKLCRNRADRAGDYTLAIVAQDGAGRPVAGAWARVYRALPEGSAATLGPWEAGGECDAAGIARVSGTRVGGKTLVIDARRLGFQLLRQPIEVAWTGFSEQRFTLAPGLAIRGRLVPPDGVELAGAQVYATATALDDWLFAELADDHASGRAFQIVGLDPGRYALHVRGRFSPVLVAVEAGGPEQVIELKRNDELREDAAHMGEIHGRLVDAATGAAVVAPWDAVECEPVDAGIDEATLRDDVLPSLASPRIVQTMVDENFVAPPPGAEFHLTGLDDRSYVVVARVAGYAPSFSRPVRIAGHALVKDVLVALERPASLRGALVDAEGKPVEGAFVVALGVGPASAALLAALDESVRVDAGARSLFVAHFARSDRAGRFELGGLLPGARVAVGVVDARFLPASGPAVALRGGEPADAGTLRLAPRR
jgi:hypothetical protein